MTENQRGPTRVEESDGRDRTPPQVEESAGHDGTSPRVQEPTGHDGTPLRVEESAGHDRTPMGVEEPAGHDRTPPRVEEPAGYDRTPTDRIPVAGDLPDSQDRPRPPVDESEMDGRREPKPFADAAELPEPVGRDEPVGEPVAVTEELPAGTPAGTGFFAEGAVDRFRDRWRELQAGFVDDPAQAVRGADELVDEIMRELAERKQNLEGRWRDAPGDTEELRVAIQEYRSFFNQLLNA
jgi:hypothetical protein